MSQLPRPIFTKSRTTKRPRSGISGAGRAGGGGRGSRFHGAFEGGHSAGFFNTVGSRDGWKPTNEEDVEEYADDGEFDEFGRSANRIGSVDGSAGKDQSNDILGASASSSIGSSGRKRPRVWDRNRSAEDYMDDRDYEDWGGPTGVSAEYSDPSASRAGHDQKEAIAANVDDGGQHQQQGLGLLVPTELLQSMKGPTDAIGRLLLRKLGWREGSGADDKSSAYVAAHEDNGGDENANDKACSHEALLSKKRLKKIQLSERGHSLPPAKIDTYGLGFDPFRNAPEFAAHRDQRKKRAEERARAAGGGGRYHTSDLFDDEDDDSDGGGGGVHNAEARASTERGGSNKSTNVLAYETAEDFIGRKGTAGFALEDDDDDVYDSVQAAPSSGMSTISGGGHASKFVGIGGEEYHTELIDHESDAEGEDSSQAKHGGSVAFAGALSAWATGGDMNGATGGMPSTTKAVTSDGRPPLDGFVLGGSGGEKDITNKRFPGPDLPPNFEPLRHVFREEDLPEQVAEQSKRAKEEAEKTRGAQSAGAATLQSYTNPQKRDDVTPMAGNAFAGLAATMKNRFTSGGSDAVKTEDKDNIGLRVPNSAGDLRGVASAVPASKQEKEEKNIEVKRSTMLWNPEPLLCKRLGVRPPSRSNTSISTQQKQTEEIYFKKEVLGAAGAAAAIASTSDPSGDSAAVNTEDIGNNDVPMRPSQPGDDIGESRPPMDLFKSIFGAPSSDSDDSSSSDEDDSKGEGSAAASGTSKDTSTPVTNPLVDSGSIGEGIGAQNNKEISDNQEATNPERSANGNEKKDKSRKYRSRSRRSRSSDSASSESSESSSSYEQRRQKKKSKRRKKEKSKNYDDERKRSKDERRKKKRRKRSRSRSRSRDRGRDIERKPAKKSSRSTSGGGT